MLSVDKQGVDCKVPFINADSTVWVQTNQKCATMPNKVKRKIDMPSNFTSKSLKGLSHEICICKNFKYRDAKYPDLGSFHLQNLSAKKRLCLIPVMELRQKLG
jgi:hypothetical protein